MSESLRSSLTIVGAIRLSTRSEVISASLIAAALVGLSLVIFLVAYSGAAEVASAMLLLGWWLAPIALFHVVPLFFSTLSWRALMPPADRTPVLDAVWIRWIRESINALLPVAGVGGDIVGARLAHRRGLPGVPAAAAMVVDTTVGVVTQLVFVLVGLALLIGRSGGFASVPAAGALLIGVAALASLVAIFVSLQHRSLFLRFANFARRFAPGKWPTVFAGSALAIDAAIVATYRRGFAFLRANVLRLAAWAGSAGEIWLLMHFLHKPFSATDAFVLESLTSGVSAVAFLVPGALGAQEGGFVVFGALLGLPPDTALAISLSKRVRELLLGLPGLFVWQYIEGRYFFHRGENQARRRAHCDGPIAVLGEAVAGEAVAGDSVTAGKPIASRRSARRI
ncbi:MAG: flippase-like domain-containing protein [Hyphomicrobiales bacterium]|nr:flippase-like domain-containing protein [Hyphomicrobiales bacterium]